MANKFFLKIAIKKEQEIIESLQQAFKDSIDNKRLQFHVDLYDDCSLSTWYQVAGGNDYHQSIGRDHVSVGVFNNEYTEIEPSDDDYIKNMSESQLKDYKDNKDNYASLHEFLEEKHNEIIEKTMKYCTDCYKDDYSNEEARQMYENFVEKLSIEDD